MIECDQPIRSAITVAGIVGVTANSSRIRGSTASTSDPRGCRSYFGGTSRRNAARTVFLEHPTRRAITLIGIPSLRCNRRISAQSSTLFTLHTISEGVRFRTTPGGQFSPVVDTPSRGGVPAILHRRDGYLRPTRILRSLDVIESHCGFLSVSEAKAVSASAGQ